MLAPNKILKRYLFVIKINKNMTIKQHIALGFSAISAILFAAVLTTLILTEKINNTTKEIVEERMPSTENSSLMVNHINASLAFLRGWLLTGNDTFKADRNAIWEEIDLTTAQMDLLATKWQSQESIEKWGKAKHYLEEFKQIQKQVEQIGHTLDEKPANKILIEQATPLKADMYRAISTMIDLENNHVPDSVKKAEILTALRAATGYGGIVHHFKNHLLRISKQTSLVFDESIKKSRALLDEYTTYPLNDDELLAIETINRVISLYVKNRAIINGGNGVPEVMDKKVKVDESMLVEALTFLDNVNSSATSGKQKISSQIRILLGYNGFIHHFKNYVLRKQESRRKRAEQSLNEVGNVIDLYRLHALTPRENSALLDLERVLSEYRTALENAATLIAKGANAKEIDNKVKIDDKPALKALAFIDASIANALSDPEEAIKLKSATLQDRARLLGNMSNFRSSLDLSFSELQAFLITGEEKHSQLFKTQWQRNTEKFAMLSKLQYLMLDEQLNAFKMLAKARAAFSPLPESMFTIRRSARWNMSNYLIMTETGPLTEKILGLLAGERNAEGVREGGLAGSERAQLLTIAKDNASSVTQLITIQWLLLLAGLITAFIIGKRTKDAITAPLREVTKAMTSIAAGESVNCLKDSKQPGVIGHLTKAASVFQQSTLKTEDENWKKTQIANVSAKAQQADTLVEFCREVIDTLTPLIKGSVGVFYVYKPESKLLEMEASYSFVNRKNNKTSFQLREGIIGQAAYEQQNIILSPVPDDFIKVSSALGESSPATLIVLPVLYRDNLLGVIEIASFEPLSTLNQELLDEMMPTMALSLENLNQVINTQILLEETKRQSEQLRSSSEELRASEEELRASEEELRVINEELVENARGLEEKSRQLEKAELKQREINEQLSEHNEAMKAQQQKLEKALTENQRQTEEIKQSSRYKSEFLANMSHELRTPLNSLLILSKSLSENEDGDLNEDNVEAAEIIHESGTSLLHRINEILDLSKVEAGKMHVNSSVVMLDDIRHGIKRAFSHVAAEKSIDFDVILAESAPSSITSDPEKLVQILDNLIVNAIKFTKEGSVTLTIKVPETIPEVVKANNILEPIQFAITDTGIGINAEHLETIFEPFRQADGSTSREFGGTGLGLSISKKFAELLGGVIFIESVEGEGSVFSLYIPSSLMLEAGDATESSAVHNSTRIEVSYEKEAKTANELDDSDENKDEIHEDLRTLAEIEKFIDDDRDSLNSDDQVVLVVEDDPYFAKILIKRIQKQELKAVATADPYDALLLAKLLQPMGIVLDVELPQMDGIEVYKQLKAIAKTDNIPVHFMSASNAELRAKAVGNANYFAKPVTKEQIDEAITGFSIHNNNELQSVLIIDDDSSARAAACEQFNLQEGIEIFEAATGAEALTQLQQHNIECIILELNLPDIDGIELLEQMSMLPEVAMPQVVVYSSRDLSDEEVRLLRKFTDSLVLKDGSFADRLQDEVMLFLHSVKEDQEEPSTESVTKFSTPSVAINPSYEADLVGKTVLVVDDDIRNTFALSRALSDKGMKVLMSKNGAKSVTMLEDNPHIDIVLMDTMMPGMDGNEATQLIRAKPQFKNLPILMITAKTMKGDQEVSMAAGASDYLSKPIDMDKLLSMMRAWL